MYERFADRARKVNSALSGIVETADRRLLKAFPRKAVGLLDRCAARAHLKVWEAAVVDAATVEEVVRDLTAGTA